MWCALRRRRRYLAVNMRVRIKTTDSGAVRSHRVPNLKKCAKRRRILKQEILFRALQRRKPPADHGRFQRTAGFVIAPSAVRKTAGEWQLVGSALILAQDLDRHPRWRASRAIEFSQSSFARCH